MMSPFEIVEPIGRETPLVVEVPHSGLQLDAAATRWTCASAHALAMDADLYVHEIFADAPNEGATLLVSTMSRYVVDLNRAETDIDALVVEGGAGTDCPRGLVWRLSTHGERVLAGPLPRAELERRLNLYYRPYHAALEAIIRGKLQRFGTALVLSGHSMPSRARREHPDVDRGGRRADIVPGSRGRTTAAEGLIDEVEATAISHKFEVRHDDPYRGGHTTSRHGRPYEQRHAIQVEIARRLYMNELSLESDRKGLAAVRLFARDLVARLAVCTLNLADAHR